MKKSIGAKTIIHPLPVLIVGTYNPNGQPNIMAVSWGGICCSQPPCIAISIREVTQTYQNIVDKKCFTVNIPSEKHVVEADYAGIASGRDENKFEKAGLTAIKSEIIDAPYVDEFPYFLECKLMLTTNIGLHTQFIGEILDLKADGDVLNDKGKPDIKKVRPIIYGSFSNSTYFGIGEEIGEAFSIGKKIE